MMAKFIEYDKLASPTNDIYHIVPLKGLQGVGCIEYKWIEENCIGKWSAHPHDYPCSFGNGRQLYYFSEESDAVAFKLRWL